MNRREHVKQTGDSHPPDVELDPDVPATAAALGIQSRMRMDPRLQDIQSPDQGSVARSTPNPRERTATGLSTGKAIAWLVAGLVCLRLLRR